ncbi:MAG: beta-lactamase family protein [Treponema sp.]|nr:beta-lactamase family protein [Treponema sp.]
MKLEKSPAPELLGIPSVKLLEFLLYLEEKKMCMHSILILRHGKIAFEAFYPPFTGDTLHRMYSVTKSFVSAAIGFMIDEGKISLQSRMADFFPEYLNKPVDQYKREMTVRDLLLMATPYDFTTYTKSDSNWNKTFYTAEPSHSGGAVFSYDTSGTVALTALVEKLSGQNLVDYLRPRLFEPLGFSDGVWCVERPEGGAWGGSGLLCSAYDLAGFGLFLLNRGSWQGRQLLSASYLKEACSPLIDNRVSTSGTEMQFGYGYQIWQTRNNGFCAWGMGTQLAVCLPEKDTLLITNGDTQSIPQGQDILLDAFWRFIYPYIEENPINVHNENIPVLKNKLASLEFPCVDGKEHSPEQDYLSGGKYGFGANSMKIRWTQFDFTEDEGTMKYENSSGVHEIHFGLGRYKQGIFPENGYFDKRIGTPANRGYRYKASGAWFNPHSLTIYLYIIDNYFGTLKINCYFENESLTLQMSKAAEWFLDEYTGMATGSRIS